MAKKYIAVKGHTKVVDHQRVRVRGYIRKAPSPQKRR
jgi:hypothetical protein